MFKIWVLSWSEEHCFRVGIIVEQKNSILMNSGLEHYPKDIAQPGSNGKIKSCESWSWQVSWNYNAL